MAQRFGGKYVFGIGVVMTAVLTLLTPLAAQTGVWALVVLRVLEGLFEVKLTFPLQFYSGGSRNLRRGVLALHGACKFF